MRTTPPLDWVRSFEAAARLGSFSAAAQDLNLTQAAVSKHIQNLEAWAKRPLFERLPRGVRLTDAGRAYRPVVTDALHRLRVGTEEVFGREHGGALTLRVNAAFCALILAPRLGDFTDAHPNITVNVLTNVWPTEHLEGEIDLEIRYGGGPWPGMRTTKLIDGHMVVVASKDQTINGDPQNLATARLLHVMGYQRGWRDWFSAHSIDRDDAAPDVMFDNSEACLAAAEAGVGFALVHDFLAAPYLDRGTLNIVNPHSIESEDAYYAIGHPRIDRDLRVSAFLDWLTPTMEAASANAANLCQT